MNYRLLIIIIFILSNFCLFAQGKKDDPSWVYLQRAENLKEKGDYSNAIIEARKAKLKFINERLDEYYNELRSTNRDKTDYEIKKIVEKKRTEMATDDNFPRYHEIMGDLFILTNFLSEAEKEYKKALLQKTFFEYKEKEIELKYKLASVYEKLMNFEVADIIYREIALVYLNKRNPAVWSRYKDYISKDSSLDHIFRIFKEEGIEYQEALFKIGRRSAILGRYDDALFYLSNSAIVFMTYNSDTIRKTEYNFQYSGPVDFINYLTRKDFAEYFSFDSYYFDEILLFIGYVNQKKGENTIASYYYDLSLTFSKMNKRVNEIKYMVEYLKKNKDHNITYEEIKD
jgi:hypothetical protein